MHSRHSRDFARAKTSRPREPSRRGSYSHHPRSRPDQPLRAHYSTRTQRHTRHAIQPARAAARMQSSSRYWASVALKPTASKRTGKAVSHSEEAAATRESVASAPCITTRWVLYHALCGDFYHALCGSSAWEMGNVLEMVFCKIICGICKRSHCLFTHSPAPNQPKKVPVQRPAPLC